jgi:hypothetical protein
MTFKTFSKKSPLLWLYLGGALLLIVAAWLWWARISTDPERVFWSTIEQSLTTRGVTVVAEQGNGGSSVRQIMQYSIGGTNFSHNLTDLNQQGTKVRSEIIGTPPLDYTRYVSIKTDQKKADGSDLDFSKLVGEWTKGGEGSGQVFAQSVIGSSLPLGGMGVPVANVPPKARAELIRQMHDDMVYQASFNKVKKERVSGRLLYTYDVALQPVAYVALMKEFAKAVGLRGLEQLDPKAYEGQPSFKLRMVVDARAHHIVRLISPENGYEQTYTAYDIPARPELPNKTITSEELQKRFSDLQ